MPLYEYKCTQCEKKVEMIRLFSDPPITHCPSCGGDMKKVISAPAIQFKGSGFYKTDYASKKSDSSSSTASGESKSEAKTETKSEAKSEAKSDTKSSG